MNHNWTRSDRGMLPRRRKSCRYYEISEKVKTDHLQCHQPLNWCWGIRQDRFPLERQTKAKWSLRNTRKTSICRDLRERADISPSFNAEFGHLEGNTIVGEKYKSAVITLVEHLSKAIITLKTKGQKQVILKRLFINGCLKILAISLSR